MRLQLARLDDARRAFIANASHELRTPIFSLGGFLELLQEDELDDDTRAEFVAAMSEQMTRLSKLATDLLDLSRLDAGGMRIEIAPLSLAEVAADLAEELGGARGRPRAPARHGGRGGRASRSETASACSRSAGPSSTTPSCTRRPGRRCGSSPPGSTLRVEDDGPGIPAEHQEQVFARFTRLEGSRASGSGLGLAIARELADRMGGDLRLESRPGRTVFTLELPAAREGRFTGKPPALRGNPHESVAR